MNKKQTKVLVVATSRKTRGGITSVVKAHETGKQWKQFHCKWIQTHRDGNALRKLWYLGTALLQYILLLPFYDIVHIHVGLRTSIKRKTIFAKLAKTFNKKIIIHFHPATEKHLFDKEYSGNIKTIFNYAHLLIVLSHQWIKWINEAFPDNNYNFEVLYNPCPQVNRNNTHKEKYILFAGTLIERKGYNRLIEAFSQIANKYLDWQLVFAGNGEIENAKKIQQKLDIPIEQIKYLGWISGTEKETVFQNASVYCLPSWGEGFPMGILDAIAYGIPIVTTPVGGVPDIIIHKKNGYVFDIYNTEMLAKELEILILSENKRKSFVVETDKLLKHDFDVNVINNQLATLYQDL